MTTEEALDFLRRHQPLPPDAHLDQATLTRFDDVRKFFVGNPDNRSVSLLLNSFGDGSGFGVYQLVGDAITRHSPEVVVPSLNLALASPHPGVRYWSLQIALGYRDRTLLPHFVRLLQAQREGERVFAAYNLSDVAERQDRPLIAEALRNSWDPDVRLTLEEALARIR